MTKIVNIRKEKCDVFCGRGSIFGNPYLIGRDGSRDEVVDRYEREWFPFLLKDASFVSLLKNLKNKKLGCFCKSDQKEVRCHLDVIKKWLDSYEGN